MLVRPASLRSRFARLRAPIARPAAAIAGDAAALLLRCRAQARRALHDDVARRNHYDRLNVRLDATPAEIKKSFYSLSKSHHPDANPSDPNASHTFSLISESYSVLSDTSRRAAYDRDVLRLQHHAPGHAHPGNPRASYHSTNNPAGGRSPSGLSRRRGTFRGPPPSFYRSGGWGGQTEKRRNAHEESTGTGQGAEPDSGAASPGANRGPWADPFAYQQTHTHTHNHNHTHTHSHTHAHAHPYAQYSRHGGMGPGDDPFGHQEEVPHFDKHGHTRTHQREDRRRWQRDRRAVGDDDIEFEPQTSMAGHFFIISGILATTILAPLVYIQFMQLGRKSKERD
ncbi:hypothetical protein BGZ61DRAFT_477764 [Ilyonectria robusta]|uniref:uncharacterized protein n=1 Tax=Ilyonectria robusta TaxID=1079257 RepID=UPI001E8D8216|nr:uncharacterized protein BGZ61DRAFT_477764 [Ilyonectria robusta]KAH8699798.1 hypothetical protein BGZ61DRAFT_477764 [Ilyonectria robusta]